MNKDKGWDWKKDEEVKLAARKISSVLPPPPPRPAQPQPTPLPVEAVPAVKKAKCPPPVFPPRAPVMAPQMQPEVVTTPQLVRQVVPMPEAIEAARLKREAQTTRVRENIARQIADGTARILEEYRH